MNKTSLEECLREMHNSIELTDFIARYGLREILPAAALMKDPMAGLQVEPRQLDFSPTTYTSLEEIVVGCDIDIHRWEEFFSADGDMSAAIQRPICRALGYETTWGQGARIWRDGVPGIPGWDARNFLIRIGYGAYTRNHMSYGHTIDVWVVR